MTVSPRSVLKDITSIPGWNTKRHIVVFESDDWGSIRMPDIDSFDRLERLGVDLRSADAERYNRNDNLATGQDLASLFEVLSRVKDIHGNHAVFTPACIVANPDFSKIEDSGFEEYFYEPFTETLHRFPGCESSFDLWKEGIEKRLFVPQMHGREHLNVMAWMEALRAGEPHTISAFKEKVWGFVPSSFPEVDYQAAFLMRNDADLNYHKEVIKSGLKLFESLLGYRAEFFVPPNGLINNSLNKILADNGISLRYVSKIQHEPVGSGRHRKRLHYLGQKDKYGIRYIIRNCFFEPNQGRRDTVDACMHEIKTAFRLRKPAIIGTHRVNYIGSLNPENRDTGLDQLGSLLAGIQRNWPDVEFMTTAELGDLMKQE